MGDSVFGFTGKGFAILCADCTVGRSIITYKHDEDKILKAADKLLLAGAGPVHDRTSFCDYIGANLKLAKLRQGFDLSVSEAAHFCRRELATALRRAPYQVNLLIGGHDEDAGPSLYFMDYMACMHKMNYAAHGYAGYFLYALLDRHWEEGMDVEAAKELIRACIKQLHTRFLLHQPTFKIKIVDADGVREISLDE